jgi:hypothetical protein
LSDGRATLGSPRRVRIIHFFRSRNKTSRSSRRSSDGEREAGPTAEAKHESDSAPTATTGEEETADETADGTSASQGSRRSAIEFGTIAGVLAFLAGGLGTIVAAIGDFGSDSGALAAARRNHVHVVVAAAAAAALGLACGALYTILKGDANDDSTEDGKTKGDTEEKTEIETTVDTEATGDTVPFGLSLVIAGLILLASRIAKNGSKTKGDRVKSDRKAKSDPKTSSETAGNKETSGVNIPVGTGLAIVALVVLGAAGVLLGLSQSAAGGVVALVGLVCLVIAWRMWTTKVKLTQARLATSFLIIGVLAVSAGVGLGATATSAREPGRPKIEVKRVDDKTILVEISAEGLPSDDWFEASVSGYDDSYAPESQVALVTARFSPGQDGKLDWTIASMP